MSRHKDVDAISLCATASSVPVAWPDFLQVKRSGARSSPIDTFYEAHRRLNVVVPLCSATSQLSPEVANALAGQLLLGYVSATELYLRQAIAETIRLCPLLRRLNRDQQVPYGALDYYAKDQIELALTERVSFSEPGKIAAALSSRAGVSVSSGISIARSIKDFESLCQLRHALVHSHGEVNSTNASLLLGADRAGSSQTKIDEQGLQWVAAISMNLARDINNELVRSTIWRWIEQGHLSGDGRSDNPKLAGLATRLGSKDDATNRTGITSLRDARMATKRALTAFHGS